MTKQDFKIKYELSDAVPIDPTSRSVPAEAFAAALDEFINDRFRGICRVHSEIISADAILVSAEYAAYFFKMLFTYVYGRTFIDIDVSSNKSGLVILIGADTELPLTDPERRFLVKTARNAGMEIYPNGNGFKLTLAFSSAAIHHVYAISVRDGKRIMLSKLCEIFYCGAIYTKSKSFEDKK